MDYLLQRTSTMHLHLLEKRIQCQHVDQLVSSLFQARLELPVHLIMLNVGYNCCHIKCLHELLNVSVLTGRIKRMIRPFSWNSKSLTNLLTESMKPIRTLKLHWYYNNTRYKSTGETYLVHQTHYMGTDLDSRELGMFALSKFTREHTRLACWDGPTCRSERAIPRQVFIGILVLYTVFLVKASLYPY